jgi:hypothetical protein
MIPFASAINAALGNVVRLGFSKSPSLRGAFGVSEWTVNDERFFDQLESVRKLKNFLFSERVSFDGETESISLGALDFIQFHAYGRTPTEVEWNLLDKRLTALAALLTPELRRKLRIWELRLYFRTMPLYFLASAIVALGVAFIFYDPGGIPVDVVWWHRVPAFGAVVLWTLALGGLGACGFLGTALLNQSATQVRVVPTAGGGRVGYR